MTAKIARPVRRGLHRERPRVDRRQRPEALDDATLVQRAIEHSGLTDAAFARDVLRVTPRTLYRYLARTSPLRALNRDFLRAYIGGERRDG